MKTTKLYRRIPRDEEDAFDWDPSRPLREQWPWCGGTREEWELAQRTTQELPAVQASEHTEVCPLPHGPPATPCSRWSADPDLDDAIRAVTPHDPTGSSADTTCPNCSAAVASRLAHWHDGLGCWTCQRSGVS